MTTMTCLEISDQPLFLYLRYTENMYVQTPNSAPKAKLQQSSRALLSSPLSLSLYTRRQQQQQQVVLFAVLLGPVATPCSTDLIPGI